MNQKETNQKQKESEVKTFPVPFPLEKNNENIIPHEIKTTSKQEIVNEALHLQLKGNLIEAAKKYKLLIEQGCIDSRVFSNYGIILNDLGK